MAKALAMTAIDVLHTPGTLAKVKDELSESLLNEGKAKFTPFPADRVVANQNLVKTELPCDIGNVGWARQGY